MIKIRIQIEIMKEGKYLVCRHVATNTIEATGERREQGRTRLIIVHHHHPSLLVPYLPRERERERERRGRDRKRKKGE